MPTNAVNEELESWIEPAKQETLTLIDNSYRILPYLVSAIIVILVFGLLSYLSFKLANKVMLKRNASSLVANAIAKFVASFFILLGLYLALRTTGLTGLAFTVLGGTGLIGIGLGFALKGTFENYAAGIIISLKDIFRKGELVKIGEFEGIVQSVTTRGTTLMDYDGNNIILPNSMVIATSIKNFTRNPKMRLSFKIGIGYENDIAVAKDLIVKFLKQDNTPLLKDPAPHVSVDALGAATVNLQVFFWIDTHQVSQFKTKSWAIESVKSLLMDHKISMPDDAREIVFTTPLQVITQDQTTSAQLDLEEDQTNSEKPKQQVLVMEDPQSFTSELADLREQALQSEPPENGDTLI